MSSMVCVSWVVPQERTRCAVPHVLCDLLVDRGRLCLPGVSAVLCQLYPAHKGKCDVLQQELRLQFVRVKTFIPLLTIAVPLPCRLQQRLHTPS